MGLGIFVPMSTYGCFGISFSTVRRCFSLHIGPGALEDPLELQADFYAGVWAHHADRAQQILESGDVEEALGAASAIGDDRLQKQARGYVTPDSFTHGTSAQRARWFKLGLQTGDIEQGDTFNATSL